MRVERQRRQLLVQYCVQHWIRFYRLRCVVRSFRWRLQQHVEARARLIAYRAKRLLVKLRYRAGFRARDREAELKALHFRNMRAKSYHATEKVADLQSCIQDLLLQRSKTAQLVKR